MEMTMIDKILNFLRLARLSDYEALEESWYRLDDIIKELWLRMPEKELNQYREDSGEIRNNNE